jgi:hypothetical protein
MDSQHSSVVPISNAVTTKSDNPFMDQIGYLMDDAVFRRFFREYFSEWSDARAVIMLLQTYVFIDDEHFKRTQTRLTSDQIIHILKCVMNSSQHRKIIVEGMKNYLDNDQRFLAPLRDLICNDDLLLLK